MGRSKTKEKGENAEPEEEKKGEIPAPPPLRMSDLPKLPIQIPSTMETNLYCGLANQGKKFRISHLRKQINRNHMLYEQLASDNVYDA